MKIENNYSQQITGAIVDSSNKNNHRMGSTAADSLADDGVSMEISKRGRALVGEMQPFVDTYETTCSLLKGVGHIGSENMINGNFADVIADNYQNELQRITESYSGKELEERLAVLDKSYEEAVANASAGYVKQLRLLTGDIVLKPQTGVFYASEAEAEDAYQRNLEKDRKSGPVIDSELADIMRKDIKNILLQLKNPALDQDKKNNIFGNFLSYKDVKKLGSYLYNSTYKNADGISDFSRSVLERYAAVRDKK